MQHRSLKRSVYFLLDPSDDHNLWSSAANSLIISMIFATIIMLALETDKSIATSYAPLFHHFELWAALFFTTEYLLRVWSSNAGDKYNSRWKYVTCNDSIVDLLALLPLIASFVVDSVELRYFLVFRLFQLLKLFRYFAPLIIMATVFKAEFRSFTSAMMIMLVLVFCAATGIYLFEHNAQPEVFGSIPQAMWWAVVTLTTLGYGDIVPVTNGGKIFAGVMTVFAVGVVSLPAGMLASRFSEELNKRKQTFAMLMDDMLVDGKIDKKEEVALEKLRQQLCLSQSDVNILKRQRMGKAKVDGQTHKHHCPKCGHRYD